MTFPEAESTGPLDEALNREPPRTIKVRRWMMMKTTVRCTKVEVANSRYRSLPSCGGSALGEASTEWMGRLTGATWVSRFERLQN